MMTSATAATLIARAMRSHDWFKDGLPRQTASLDEAWLKDAVRSLEYALAEIRVELVRSLDEVIPDLNEAGAVNAVQDVFEADHPYQAVHQLVERFRNALSSQDISDRTRIRASGDMEMVLTAGQDVHTVLGIARNLLT